MNLAPIYYLQSAALANRQGDRHLRDCALGLCSASLGIDLHSLGLFPASFYI